VHPEPTQPEPLEDTGSIETNDPRRFIVCGANPLAYRLCEELTTRYDVRVTAMLPHIGDHWGDRIRKLSVEVIEAERLDAESFTRARLGEAAAVGLIEQDDGGNIDAALLAQEINPEVRIVIRMFNLTLGERISQLLNDCVVLSAAEIAAPVLVRAALDESATPVTIGGHHFIATRRELVKPEDVVMGLAISHAGQPIDPEVLLAGDAEQRTDVVLARGQAPAARKRTPQRHDVTMLSVLTGARMRLVVGVLFLIFVAGTAVLTPIKGDLGAAAYLAILSELTGANADPNAALLEKVTLILLTIVSIALIPALTAAIVDSTVKVRLRNERGGVPAGIANHVVVVGLGHVGTRVIQDFADRGITVVAIDRDVHAEGVQTARDLDIPVVIGDATRPDVLNSAAISTARALLIVSTDDVNNLEISLLGRAAQPQVRVVLRLFDGEFARRVQRAFAFNISRSVTYLAAPAFAGAMLGRNVVATIPVRRRVLVVAELPVRANSQLEHHTLSEVNRPGALRLLGVRTGRDDQVLWMPAGGRRLATTDTLIVIGTRAGLGRLLVQTRTPRNVTPPPDYSLLRRWETPGPEFFAARGMPVDDAEPLTGRIPLQPDSDGTTSREQRQYGPDDVDNPPGGPADNDDTRPA
jgi:Trk K+ transport system NAD-binding subunit